jgi:hypothetical protein
VRHVAFSSERVVSKRADLSNIARFVERRRTRTARRRVLGIAGTSLARSETNGLRSASARAAKRQTRHKGSATGKSEYTKFCTESSEG